MSTNESTSRHYVISSTGRLHGRQSCPALKVGRSRISTVEVTFDHIDAGLVFLRFDSGRTVRARRSAIEARLDAIASRQAAS
jgi:hypothetical protein